MRLPLIRISNILKADEIGSLEGECHNQGRIP